MFNLFKQAKNKKSNTEWTACYLDGTIQAIIVDEQPTFRLRHVESGMIWDTNISALTQLLLYSHDENGEPFMDVTKDINMVITEENTYRGSFPLELILMQHLDLPVGLIDPRCYARIPGTEDFYFTIRHASQIPDIEKYHEFNIQVKDAA